MPKLWIGNKMYFVDDDEVRDYCEKLEEQLKQHRWIPVSERLPKELVETIPWRSEVVFVTDGKVWDVGFCRTRQRKWNLQVKHYMKITHWKPIILP